MSYTIVWGLTIRIVNHIPEKRIQKACDIVIRACMKRINFNYVMFEVNGRPKNKSYGGDHRKMPEDIQFEHDIYHERKLNYERIKRACKLLIRVGLLEHFTIRNNGTLKVAWFHGYTSNDDKYISIGNPNEVFEGLQENISSRNKVRIRLEYFRELIQSSIAKQLKRLDVKPEEPDNRPEQRRGGMTLEAWYLRKRIQGYEGENYV